MCANVLSLLCSLISPLSATLPQSPPEEGRRMEKVRMDHKIKRYEEELKRWRMEMEDLTDVRKMWSDKAGPSSIFMTIY